MVFQWAFYYMVDRLLSVLAAQQKGTTARCYSNKTSLSLYSFFTDWGVRTNHFTWCVTDHFFRSQDFRKHLNVGYVTTEMLIRIFYFSSSKCHTSFNWPRGGLEIGWGVIVMEFSININYPQSFPILILDRSTNMVPSVGFHCLSSPFKISYSFCCKHVFSVGSS